MIERPILLSGPMVRAILAGEKTQTRRVVKPQPQPFQSNDRPGRWWWFNIHRKGWPEGRIHEAMLDAEIIPFCPYGATGDRLWVRETLANSGGGWYYAADGMSLDPEGRALSLTGQGKAGKWYRPSIHMPRWASRITLDVASVRVERLQDISEADAQAEGAPIGEYFKDDLDGGRLVKADRRLGFRVLWDSINAKRGYGWDVNPWVWVVEFRRVV